MTAWLLIAYGGGGDQQRNQLEAIKTAGAIVVGTGGAAALLLAARRQRAAEIALKQKERDQADTARTYALQERMAADNQAHLERVAAESRSDSIERRITEIYSKAADQLGSDKAPVRLAGMYALERLAQDNEGQRQTIANLLCAYLRMPYSPPPEMLERPNDRAHVVTYKHAARDSDDGDPLMGQKLAASREELQVRRAAQRILADHLGAHDYGQGGPAKQQPVWNVSIDLTGATLIGFDLANAVIREATFYEARFIAGANFRNTRFEGVVNFAVASFDWLGCSFYRAEFLDDVYFGDTAFTKGRANFNLAQFHKDVRFDGSFVPPEGIDLKGAIVHNLKAKLNFPTGWSVQSATGKTSAFVVFANTTPAKQANGQV